MIAQIACDKNSLPQGSPCSPVISNLVAHVLDMRLLKLASRAGCTYSRYVDDLTFSTNKKPFPSEIAVPAENDGKGSHLWQPGEALKSVIERSGFQINQKKTRLMYKSSRQDVTGLVVNERINVPWRYRHTARAMVHSLVNTGTFQILGVTNKDGQATVEMRQGTVNELHGILGFIDHIDFKSANSTQNTSTDQTSSEKTYRKFLLYTTFYAAETPVIICEGETDNIYLTHAIRGLAKEFPTLAEVRADGNIRLRVRLYKYPHSSTARLLGLRDGGSSVLNKFISSYARESARIAGPGLKEPVVILYDNDNGATGIRNTIQNTCRLRPTGQEAFVHVTKNLYAVATPLESNGAHSKIEDFFDSKTRAVSIDGKAFTSDNTFDTSRHYGKTIFATKVIRQRAETIDFRGFRPLLRNLSAAIDRHRASVLP